MAVSIRQIIYTGKIYHNGKVYDTLPWIKEILRNGDEPINLYGLGFGEAVLNGWNKYGFESMIIGSVVPNPPEGSNNIYINPKNEQMEALLEDAVKRGYVAAPVLKASNIETATRALGYYNDVTLLGYELISDRLLQAIREPQEKRVM